MKVNLYISMFVVLVDLVIYMFNVICLDSCCLYAFFKGPLWK